MTPGPPALGDGMVFHRRATPAEHQFTNEVSQVWIDPDRPQDLCGLHPAWSHRHPAPARFRRSDYGLSPDGSLGDSVRRDLSTALGREISGPVRMLTQIRRWGWLFNPITVFFVWDDSDGSASQRPVGAVLEVTNTPWHDRRRYPIPLAADNGVLTATFEKELHVSPFLGMDYRYEFSVLDRDDRVSLDIDVVDPNNQTVVHTALRLDRTPATREILGRSLREAGFPTHRVSAGIHTQALTLWRKGVRFVPHPRASTDIPPTSTPPTKIHEVVR